MPDPACLPRLCLVTDSSVQLSMPIEDIVAEAVSGGVGMVQLREKSMPSGKLYELAARLRAVTRDKALLFINDRIDIALAVHADGVHLPSHSVPVSVAKELGGGRLLVGKSVHGVAEAEAAAMGKADYLLLGTIYPTASHPGGKASGPRLIGEVKSRVSMPVYAIGGINPSNAGEVMRAGAHGVALIRSILTSPNPRTAAQKLREITGAFH